MTTKALLQALASKIDLLAAQPLFGIKDLERRYGVCYQTIYLWKSRGALPKPYYIPGSKTPRWRPAEIESNELTTPALKRALRRKERRQRK